MFDAVTLAAVADELNERILHGRVQEIVQLDALSFGFEIYAAHTRQYLNASVHPDDARVHLVSAKLRGAGQEPAALLSLLRKYAEGAFVDAIAPLPHERVLNIQLDHATEGVSILVIETIGRYSNLILVDKNGVVIDALKRVSAKVNRARVTLPKHPYAPPPPQAKLDPGVLEPSKLADALAENRSVPLWQVLVKTIAGVSPWLAREVEHRVPTSSPKAEELVGTLRELMSPPWYPTIALEDGEPAEYAPYALTQFESTRAVNSISAAIEEFYGAPESYAAAKEPLRAEIVEARDRLARKRDALAQSLPDEGEIERLRTSGELILAYAFQITPGQQSVAAETETGIIEIPLIPNLSVVENAQRYFKDYHRAKDAAERVPALLAAANADVDFAEQMLNDLELAENRAEIDAVIQAAREAGLIDKTRRRRASKNPSGLGEPRTVQSQDGFTILVGKNARQNEELTFHRAKPDDLWLHARNVAGAHVVILRAGREIPESTIAEAAKLAADYSQARAERKVDVIVTPRKNVHRLRGGRAGQVTVRNSSIVRIVL
ncbi:MAG: NFACT family protein [Chloroflexi bacterium]|nr:NFACT family protein [Chloroflexota bacterium]